MSNEPDNEITIPKQRLREARTRMVQLAAKIMRERSWDGDALNDERLRLWGIEVREIYDSLAPFDSKEVGKKITR